jgi:hypothetical protein
MSRAKVSPMTNTSGWRGRDRSASTATLPDLSSLEESCCPKGEVLTPVAQIVTAELDLIISDAHRLRSNVSHAGAGDRSVEATWYKKATPLRTVD